MIFSKVVEGPDGGSVIESSIEIDLHLVLSQDPIAFAYGLVQALRGEQDAERRPKKDLAEAYLAGRFFAEQLLAGRIDLPAWLHGWEPKP